MGKLFVCYEKCTTCRKAKRWLEEKGIDVRERDIKSQNPGEEELRDWHGKSGLSIGRFYNTSGQLYRSMELSKKRGGMSEDAQYKLLASDGMLVKRPILVAGDTVLVGFKQKEWEEALS